MKHEGKSTHRLSSNPREKAYHDAWIEENTKSMATPLLAYLLGDGNNPGEVSKRDALVAATVIQWIGSPVGQHFLEKVQSQPVNEDECAIYPVNLGAVK